MEARDKPSFKLSICGPRGGTSDTKDIIMRPYLTLQIYGDEEEKGLWPVCRPLHGSCSVSEQAPTTTEHVDGVVARGVRSNRVTQ